MQSEQATASALSEKDPTWHGAHAPAMVPSVWNWPATQPLPLWQPVVAHEVEPTPEQLPLAQAAQDVEPDWAENVFTGH